MKKKLFIYFNNLLIMTSCIIFSYETGLCSPPISQPVTFSFENFYGPVKSTLTETNLNTNSVEFVGSFYGDVNNINFTDNDISNYQTSTITTHYEYDGVQYQDVEIYDSGSKELNHDSTVTFGDNRIWFESSSTSNYNTGVEFLLGTLYFRNGSYNLISEDPGEYTFTITASSEIANLHNQEFTGTLLLYTNSNSFSTPEERADWFYIKEHPEFGSVRVYEYLEGYLEDGNNLGSIEIWGVFGSLNLVDFRNPGGGAFVSNSVVHELNQPVPEPLTALLFSGGLIVFSFLARHRRQNLSD